MNHKGTVPIETERLLLRPFIEADIQPAFANWTNDEAVTKFLRWPTHPDVETTASVIREWIQSYSRKDFYQWAITLKGSDCGPVGTISVVELYEETDTVQIGYCIGSRWWGQGITSEALAGIIPFLFEQVKANRIESQHDPRNPNSGRVMKKCGLRYEGTLRQADFSNQGIVDAAMYSLLAQDYYAGKSLRYVPITPENRETAAAFLQSRWGSHQMILRGESVAFCKAPGFLAVTEKGIIGAVTYRIQGEVLEILSLDSLLENRGIGAWLTFLALATGRKEGCEKAVVITTNDNLRALGFWQKQGFRLIRLYPDSMIAAREKKPEIPLIGENGIPLCHELELEMLLL